jgi:hypothetical protein
VSEHNLRKAAFPVLDAVSSAAGTVFQILISQRELRELRKFLDQ